MLCHLFLFSCLFPSYEIQQLDSPCCPLLSPFSSPAWYSRNKEETSKKERKDAAREGKRSFLCEILYVLMGQTQSPCSFSVLSASWRQWTWQRWGRRFYLFMFTKYFKMFLVFIIHRIRAERRMSAECIVIHELSWTVSLHSFKSLFPTQELPMQ